jgi:hypothetical protein
LGEWVTPRVRAGAWAGGAGYQGSRWWWQRIRGSEGAVVGRWQGGVLPESPCLAGVKRQGHRSRRRRRRRPTRGAGVPGARAARAELFCGNREVAE